MRIEKDSFGELSVPDDVLYGAQTARALSNFSLSHEVMPVRFIEACLAIKSAAAVANAELQVIDDDTANAIQKGCLAAHEQLNARQFPVDVFQTGSGTSTNMNVNEVVAALAQLSGVSVHPNDHVNMSQSSNDVIPSAIHISAVIAIHQNLVPALTHLQGVLYEREAMYGEQVKTGRTDRKSTRLNSSHLPRSRMPSSA